jgi:hypothetical protein
MTAPHQRTAHPGDDLRYPRAAAFAAVCVVLAGGGHVLASSAAHPTVPVWWTWAAGFLLVLVAALPLAGRARSFSLPRITGLLVACQLVLHTFFALSPQSGPAAGRPGGALGMAAGAQGSVDAAVVDRASRIVCGANALTAEEARRILVDAGLTRDLKEFARLTAHAGHGHPHTASSDAWLSVLPSLPMLLGHALAGLAAGWLLRRGDLALLRLAGQDLAGEPAMLRPLLAALTLVRALYAGLPGTPERPGMPPGAGLHDVPAPSIAPLQHTVIRRGPPAGVRTLALAA